MRRLRVLLLALLPSASYAAGQIVPDTLVAAAKRATLSQIDYTRRDCDDDRRVEVWLAQIVGRNVKSIKWAGGACQLANTHNPIDAGAAPL